MVVSVKDSVSILLIETNKGNIEYSFNTRGDFYWNNVEGLKILSINVMSSGI
jgi:hypothetical protein